MTAYSPPAPAGRDLRLTFEVRAQADFDQLLTPLITKAVDALASGPGMPYVGKHHTEYGEGGEFAEVTIVGYRQTWDGDETPP